MTAVRIVVALVAVALLSPHDGNGQTQSPDELRIRDLIAAHQQASVRSDLRGLVDLYAVDAEIISSSGKRISGREAIEAYYRAVLENPLTKSGRYHTHPPESIRIRFVTSDVALVNVASVNVGGTDSTGKSLPESRTPLATVWRKEPAGWRVVEQRSLPTPPPSP